MRILCAVERVLRLLVDHRADVGRVVEGIADIERLRWRRPACRWSRSATSSCTNSTRAAEQRWPALSKAERTASRTTCSGSAVESAIMALMPPVSAMNGTMAPRRSASAFWIAHAVSFEPVKATPLMRGSLTSASPSRPPPGSRCRTSRRHAGLVQQLRREEGRDRRLLGGLGEDGVAGGERGGDLAGEDRQREVPRRDAGEGAAAVQRQHVALAGRPGKHDRARRTGAAPRTA